jgi:predicted homoserine dehydrogenase-like protein
MNLHRLLQARAAADNPVRVGVIGCGKFASMYLAQVPRIPGVHVAAIADIDPGRARDNLERIGWPGERVGAASLKKALKSGGTWLTADTAKLFAAEELDVIVEATGDPPAGIGHALAAADAGKSIVMVNVEADAVAGPYLATKVQAGGGVYSLAYGDQPALICELVDWARAAGFPVMAAGRGHKWLPEYRTQVPDDTVWGPYGLTPERARAGGMNPRMYTSFLDGTKPAIETTAVANATGLSAPHDGLAYQPCSIDQLPQVMKPRAEGGTLEARGQVAVASSLTPDGKAVPNDIRWGVWVVYEAGDDYVKRCFGEVGLVTDDSGRYACSFKRWHIVGLELGISVASVALRGEPTGVPTGYRADAVAMAKRDLKAGEILDGEGGYTVSGTLMPAERSLAEGALPIGLAHNVKLHADVKAGAILRKSDVALNRNSLAVIAREEMERAFAPEKPAQGKAAAE